MKRYLLFMYDEFYPEGGMYDFFNDFDTIEEARKVFVDHVNEEKSLDIKLEQNQWPLPKTPTEFGLYQIYDTKQRKIIETNDERP